MRKFLRKIINSIKLSRILLFYSLCTLSFAYGYLSYTNGWFPHKLIVQAIVFIDEINDLNLSEHYVKTDFTKTIPSYKEESAYNGLSIVTSRIENRKVAVRVIDMEGELIHRWDPDWFDLWPDATHIPKSARDHPKFRPTKQIHGVLLLENGDLIFNFEYLGMIRLDICGNVIWRLPYRTHHSLYLDEHDNIWVPGRIIHDEPHQDLPYHEPPITEPTVLKVSLDGKIIREISVFEILMENDLEGLLYLSSLGNEEVSVTGDTMHLNDVETFPSYLAEGVFKTGDIMLSLRNINTILVFSEEELKATHVSTGKFVRQHDPDFIDGNRISVFDNHNIGPRDSGHQSRILIESFDKEGQSRVYYSGNEEEPFYSSILGNHQWLPNGNLLITESMEGRAFEVDQQGNIVWEYVNIIRPGYAGIVEDVQRLPSLFTKQYFNQLSSQCNTEYEY